ncbi:unnamed protein product [Heligmosomoides polygyrus]|uniref:C-type lectin domain-containing protein n=1 Tax=Heligmosomoides polygyrus TaxID=6339 RepID=A0A183G4Q4_HELPZ|nr:unnamed protein product [Heligmosomoides polygyrus]
MDYVNWDKYRGEPNNFVPEEKCAELLADKDFAGKWADVGCAVRTRGFLCKKAGRSGSAEDWDRFDDNF